MRTLMLLTAALVIFTAMPRSVGVPHMIEVAGEGAKYWPRWRGPSGQGLVPAGKYANTWSPTSHVAWRVAVPGQGNSSPIVWGDRIFLTTAYSGERLSMVAFARGNG
jgi:hypothetical protein